MCGERGEVIECRVDSVDTVERWDDLKTKAVGISGRCGYTKITSRARVVLGRN